MTLVSDELSDSLGFPGHGVMLLSVTVQSVNGIDIRNGGTTGVKGTHWVGKTWSLRGCCSLWEFKQFTMES